MNGRGKRPYASYWGREEGGGGGAGSAAYAGPLAVCCCLRPRRGNDWGTCGRGDLAGFLDISSSSGPVGKAGRTDMCTRGFTRPWKYVCMCVNIRTGGLRSHTHSHANRHRDEDRETEADPDGQRERGERGGRDRQTDRDRQRQRDTDRQRQTDRKRET